MPRWFFVLFAILLALAIYWDVQENATDDAPDWGESAVADRYADREAAAAILAKARAEQAFKASSGDAAREAARTAALKVLLDGGCIAWEMSEWDPSRGMAERATPKNRAEAEKECGAQAEAIASRIAARGR